MQPHDVVVQVDRVPVLPLVTLGRHRSEGRQRAGGGKDSSAPSRRAAWLQHAEVRAALVDIAVVIINAVVNNIIIVIVTMMKAKMNNDVAMMQTIM